MTPFPARPPEAPHLGVGIGARPVHYPELLQADGPQQLGVDWLEAISENFMIPGGRPLRVLGALRERFPLVLHGVSLNVGSADPLDARYLRSLRELAQRFEPAWLSDHLCWTGVDGHNLHDLLPLPCTDASLVHVSERIARVQDALGRRIAIENASSYLAYQDDGMPEWEFLCGVAERGDCGILLDVNNVFVSAHNHGFDAETYLRAVPPERVFQIHLAGHSEEGALLIDTHDHPVRDEVWSLFELVLRRTGPVSTLIEWDDHIPALDELVAHAARAREILQRIGREGSHDHHAPRSQRPALDAAPSLGLDPLR